MDSYTNPNFNSCAVITIDTQNDFSLPGAVAEIQGTYEVIPRMQTILEACRSRQIPIVHVIRLYKEDGSNVDLCRRERIASGAAIVRPGTPGAELVSAIQPQRAPELNAEELLQGSLQSIGQLEWAMYKPRWGAFYQTPLERFLQDRQIDTLIFIGCNFPNCPRTSIYQASERDFRIVMVEDAVSGVYSKGLEELRSIGVSLYTTEQIVREIAGGES